MADVKPKPEPDDPEQSKRFKEAARELEADETGAAFKRAIKIFVPSKKLAESPKGAP